MKDPGGQSVVFQYGIEVGDLSMVTTTSGGTLRGRADYPYLGYFNCLLSMSNYDVYSDRVGCFAFNSLRVLVFRGSSFYVG